VVHEAWVFVAFPDRPPMGTILVFVETFIQCANIPFDFFVQKVLCLVQAFQYLRWIVVGRLGKSGMQWKTGLAGLPTTEFHELRILGTLSLVGPFAALFVFV